MADLLQQILTRSAQPPRSSETGLGRSSIEPVAGKKIGVCLSEIASLLNDNGDMRKAVSEMARIVEKHPGGLSPKYDQQMRKTVNEITVAAQSKPQILSLLSVMRGELARYLL